MLSLAILFLGVLLYTVPTHMKNLITYILSSKHLAMEKITQEQILFQLSENLLTDLGRVFLGASSVLLVPSTLGYVGAVRESKVLLIMYLTPLTMLLAVEVLFLILLPAASSLVYTSLTRVGEMSLSMYRVSMEESNLVSWVWDQTMAGLQCCGVHNYTDFTHHSQGWRPNSQVTYNMHDSQWKRFFPEHLQHIKTYFQKPLFEPQVVKTGAQIR